MSADTKTRKRKSGDNVVPTAKKAKTATSAEKPAPLKSALKKSKDETTTEAPKAKKVKASTKTPKEPVIEAPEESDDEEGGGAELSADRTAELLAGFSSSEDEDGEDEDDGGIEISKLPSAPVQKSLTKKDTTADSESTPGVIYISRIPHGFFEPQMHAYFSQFGTITHLRLARNKSTGKSQHHAFMEFASSAVADIVAKTMDKYLLFGHILQCRRVPQEQVKEGMWDKKKGRVRKGGRGKVRNRVEGARLRKGAGRGQWEGRVEREAKRREEKAEKMREMGYEFEMPAVRSVGAVPIKEIDAEAGIVEEGGVKLLEGKKVEVAPGVEEKIEKVVEVADGEPKITEEKTIKRKNKTSGATTTTKKRKVKATA